MEDLATNEEMEAIREQIRQSPFGRRFAGHVAAYHPGTERLVDASMHATAMLHQRQQPGTPCPWCYAICEVCENFGEEQIARFVEKFIRSIEHEATTAAATNSKCAT